MTARIDGWFLRMALLYMLAGITLGIAMAMSADHTQMPTHAHINLLGWASMALYAIVYRIWPEAARSPMAWWHFWLANAGTLVTVIGVAGITAGHPESFEPLAGIGSVTILLSAVLFAVIAFLKIPATTATSERAAGGERIPSLQ